MGLAAEPAVPTEDLDRKVWQLREAAERFAREPIVKKLGWLYQVRQRVARAAGTLGGSHLRAYAPGPGRPGAGEAWILGPVATLRALRLLSAALADIQRQGAPRLPASRGASTTASSRCGSFRQASTTTACCRE